MKILFDTSVVIAAMIEPHPMHSFAFPWLKRAKSKEFQLFIACHTLAETYAVLTTLPVSPKITPLMAQHLIDQNLKTISKIVPLSSYDYFSVVRSLARASLPGGSIYDALIARAAQKSRVDKLLTLNMEHFKRVWPEGTEIIFSP